MIIPVTGGLSLFDPCTNNPGVSLTWQVSNANAYNVTIVWWIVGGTSSGGPLVVPANSAISFDTLIDGPLPNTMAIMWVDPADGKTKTLSHANSGVSCGEAPSPTPTATMTPGVLIPVTGIELPAIFRESMFLNLGIGIFGFAMILLGIGIKLDRDHEEDDEDEDED